ncbi:hypothetical protein EDB19DRAFT_1833910 [Suillus lakei]|nr:hypothetical protein EDB19DRAFT_1833910 [Suillus lakei]
MPSAETSNQAVNHAGAQVIQILAGAVKLWDGNPEHLRLAVQMGEIMSPVFATHAISATVVPPVLLSAAIVLVWENITTNDPQIQQHPLKDKACTIFVSRLVPSTSAAGVTKSVPGPGPSRPKPKPVLKKKLVEGKADKGKGKEVVLPEDVQDVQGRGRTLAIKKRRRDSGSSEPLVLPGALQSSFENATPLLATISKKQKVAEVPLLPPADHSNIEVVQNQVKVLQEESVTQDETLWQAQVQLARQEQATSVLQGAYNTLRHCVLGHNQPLSPPFPSPMYHANPPYSGNHSMMPVSMGQMQAMESLYFNLPTGASVMGGPSVGNVTSGSGWNGTGGPSAS